MTKSPHNNYITIVKALGIILMVIGHSGCPLILSKFIYLFHMPLFFFCSGIFMKTISDKETALAFLKKRIVGLYFPFVKWSILFLSLHNLFMLIGIYNPYYGFEGGSYYYTLEDIIQKLFFILFTMHEYEELLGGFWFIRALFISSIIIAVSSLFLNKVKRNKYELLCLIYLLLTILIRRLASDSEFWRDISMGMFGAFFYMLGYVAMRYSSYWYNKYVVAICCISMVLLYIYFEDGISMGCGYNKVIPFSISAISGTLLTLYVSKLIEKRTLVLKRFLYCIGNHTLVILALHFLSFRFISYFLVLANGLDVSLVAEHPVITSVNTLFLWWIVYAIIGVVVPIILVLIYQYICNSLNKVIIWK